MKIKLLFNCFFFAENLSFFLILIFSASAPSGRLGHRKSSLALTPEEDCSLDTTNVSKKKSIKHEFHLISPIFIYLLLPFIKRLFL